jgi:hypothetical protein
MKRAKVREGGVFAQMRMWMKAASVLSSYGEWKVECRGEGEGEGEGKSEKREPRVCLGEEGRLL